MSNVKMEINEENMGQILGLDNEVQYLLRMNHSFLAGAWFSSFSSDDMATMPIRVFDGFASSLEIPDPPEDLQEKVVSLIENKNMEYASRTFSAKDITLRVWRMSFVNIVDITDRPKSLNDVIQVVRVDNFDGKTVDKALTKYVQLIVKTLI